MGHRNATRDTLVDLLIQLDTRFARTASVYLIGETSQLFEGWRHWTSQIEIAGDVAREDQTEFTQIVDNLQAEFDVRVFDESPADVIPLPAGYESRAERIQLDGLRHLHVYHFDPYSVVLRFIARGDEPDYHMALMYIEHGWVNIIEMDAKLVEMVPQLTSQTIQQDPAELRRKYKGMLQMWKAVTPRTTHRPTRV